jgi:hypothetical protein
MSDIEKEAPEGKSADSSTQVLVEEAHQGLGTLTAAQRENTDRLKAGGKSGVTGEFGKPMLLDSDESGENVLIIGDVPMPDGDYHTGDDDERARAEDMLGDLPKPVHDGVDNPSERDLVRDEANESLTLSEKYDQLDMERAQLEVAAESKMKDPAQLKRFNEDMEKLTEREDELTEMYRPQYEKQGYSPDVAEDMARARSLDEIKDTMAETRRILEAEGDEPLKPEQRVMLAEQVIHHAADPTTVEQGHYGTCQAAAMESRMYARDPSTAAKLVADVATTGEYTAADGSHVKLHKDNFQPDSETGNWPTTGSGDRSLANQLFQSTAINLRYQKTDPNCQYVIKPGGGKPPDRLIDISKGTDGVYDDGSPWVFNGYPTEDIAVGYNTITGREEYDVGLTSPPYDVEPVYATSIESEDQLDAKLTDLKANGKLPVLLWVHTAHEPFFTDSNAGAAGGSGGGHYVNVTDYDPGPPSRVEIDNQWGEGNDHQWKSSADIKQGVTTKSLWAAMHAPAD